MAQDVKRPEELPVGLNEPGGQGDVVQRARIIIASIKVAANNMAMKARGWIDLYGRLPDNSGTNDGSGQSALFTAMTCELPSGVDVAKAKVRFTYSRSR